jgi:hypothetical protein
MRYALFPAAALFALAAVTATPANAIDCKGNFQVQRDGQRIVTPYCEDAYLAQVAHEYGMAVSATAVRNNPSVKEKICRFIGDDNRVRDTCGQYLHDFPDDGR